MFKEINSVYSIIKKKINNSLNNYEKSNKSKEAKKKILEKDIENIINNEYKNLDNVMFDSFEKKGISKVNKVLREISKNSRIKLILLNREVKNMVSKIINRKINNLTTKQRLERNRQKIIKDSVKIIKVMLPKTSIPEISKELQRILKIDKNKALLIARTESHRIQEESNYNTLEKARKKGIDHIRQWLATKDSRTRDTHRVLDGKFEDDEGYFHSSGGKTKFPGNFGIAKEDIRCRCTLIAVFPELEGIEG